MQNQCLWSLIPYSNTLGFQRFSFLGWSSGFLFCFYFIPKSGIWPERSKLIVDFFFSNRSVMSASSLFKEEGRDEGREEGGMPSWFPAIESKGSSTFCPALKSNFPVCLSNLFCWVRFLRSCSFFFPWWLFSPCLSAEGQRNGSSCLLVYPLSSFSFFSKKFREIDGLVERDGEGWGEGRGGKLF